MKAAYPLTLKVSAWLLLNLLLLAALGVGFFVVQGGLGWEALLVGGTEDRLIMRHNAISSEYAAASPQNGDSVLARASEAYDARIFLYGLETQEIIGADLGLPPRVQDRLELSRMTGPREFGRREGGRPPPGYGAPPPPRGDKAPPVAATADRAGAGRDEFRGPPPQGPRFAAGEPPRGPPDPKREREGIRFLVRDGAPAAYWIGTRSGLASPNRRPAPTMVVARVESFWGLLRYLELQSWILGGGAVLGLSIVFWLPLVRGITRAISQLTRATEQIADGRFDTRVPSNRRDEIGQLGDSVNRMAARLDAHMAGQKKFLADVAHELCSPLARLQMATGILAERAPAELSEMVADVREEAQHMSTLVNELLAFTKSGLKAREVVLADVDLAALARKAIDREDPAGRVIAKLPESLVARGDAALLDRAVGNLVRNALRYAGGDAAVEVSATRDGDRVVIAVDDDGPGVPPEALDRLGEPFFRPELARTRETGGTGLGLSIVRSSVAACGGDVRFANRHPHGFHAEIRLPTSALAT